MSTYFKTGKGWRYDFILQGNQAHETWFKTKTGSQRSRSKQKGGNTKPATRDTDSNRHGLLGLG